MSARGNRRICSVVYDNGCKAPAGVRVGDMVGDGEGSCRGTCVNCGEPVCSNCSHRTKRQGGRVCFNCAETNGAM